MPNLKSKKAQATLFIILAVIIVVLALSLYFVFSKTNFFEKPNEVESYFQACINDQVKQAVATAELQGGYLLLPDFNSGSEAFPFSNYFKFVSLDIPYWSYVSGNGVQKNQQPELEEIENQFSQYLSIYLKSCQDFREFSSEVNYSKIENVSVKISSGSIETTVIMPLVVKEGETVYRSNEHKVRTNSEFGSLYNTAKQFFEENSKKTILANYSLDTINSYVPVNGMEISCIPKVLSKLQIQNDLKSALQENIQELKVKGSNFYLKTPQNKYFVINLDQPVDKQFNFLFIKNWPATIEIWPNEGDVIKMEPLGKDSGLGSLGFCIMPYHFVYDLSFPVLIQITSGTEMFQFPVLVVIDKMTPVNFEFNETIQPSFNLCSDSGQIGTVFTAYNSNPIESDISFRCLQQRCSIGKTEIEGNSARLTANFPKCVNGYVVVSSEGYKSSEALVSTNEPFILSIALSKIYELPIEINAEENERATISFKSSDYSAIVSYPEQSTINLSEGDYEVSVQLYKDATISIGKQEIEKCVSVPAPGIPGMLGLENQECYNLTLPASQFTSVPIGGGKTEFSIEESDLANAKKLKLQAERFETPASIEDLMDIYDSINLETLQVSLIKK